MGDCSFGIQMDRTFLLLSTNPPVNQLRMTEKALSPGWNFTQRGKSIVCLSRFRRHLMRRDHFVFFLHPAESSSFNKQLTLDFPFGQFPAGSMLRAEGCMENPLIWEAF